MNEIVRGSHIYSIILKDTSKYFKFPYIVVQSRIDKIKSRVLPYLKKISLIFSY